ncbi:SPFH domain-containing protein [Lachnospiraceae bacterium C1.1]|nr:SPFH domain-containing protein [Lachnospiraceae bacterium C1.1]
MALTSVIKYEGDNSVFVWKYPATDFNNGSQLIVHESQEAIFMMNGEVLEVFGPGKHVLETENLPFIKQLQRVATGGRSTFHCECYFVNLTEQMAIKWGTDSKITYMDPEYNFPLEIGACGQMSLAVSNSTKLLIKIVGTTKSLTQATLTSYFRAFLMNRIKSIIPSIIISKKISIFNIDQYLGEISEAILPLLENDFDNYGIDLRTFLITTVLKPDEDPNFRKFKELHYRKITDVAEAELNQRVSIINEQTKAQKTMIEAEAIAKKRQLEGYTYQQERGFDVASEMAKNDAVAQMNNVGIGMGMMTGIGGTLGQQVGTMATSAMQGAGRPNITNESRCVACGHQLNPGAIFCEKCGTKVNNTCKCVNCGAELSEEAIFCSKCGTRRG